MQSHSVSLISKPLSQPVDARSIESPVGQSLPESAPAGASRLSHEVRPLETVDTFDVDGDGRADLRRAWDTSGPNRRLVEEDLRTGDTRVYLAKEGASGRVTYFVETSARGSRTVSSGSDGRVDWVSESLQRLPGFKVEGYDPSWSASRIYNRVLEDTDHDGMLDTESITGDWFRTEA
jgi:hypothetical protein